MFSGSENSSNHHPMWRISHSFTLKYQTFYTFFYYFFVAEDGSVWSWGWNSGGRVGNGKTNSVLSVVPECVSLLKGKNIINLWSMAHSTIVLCDGTHILNTFFFDLILLFLFVDRELDGSLWGWGWNGFGELGLGHKNPVSSPTKMSLTSVRHLQVGHSHVIAVCSNIFDDCKTHNNNR